MRRHLPSRARGFCTARGLPPLSLAQLRQRPFVMAGPNVIESEDHALRTAAALRSALERYDASFIFKASFDKANRTSGSSYRGVCIERAVRLFERVRAELGVPIITDVHEAHQPAILAHCVDVFQIPAFLCRRGRRRGEGRGVEQGLGGAGRGARGAGAGVAWAWRSHRLLCSHGRGGSRCYPRNSPPFGPPPPAGCLRRRCQSRLTTPSRPGKPT